MKSTNRSLYLIPLMISFSTFAAHASEEPRCGVSVSGQCTREVTPDRGSVTVTAQARDRDLKAANRKATEIYEKVKSSVERLKLADIEIQTSEYQMQEDREWVNNKWLRKGFIARMGLRVTTSAVSRLGEVIEIASREGVEDTGSLTTFLSPEKSRKEQILCLEDAVNHAKTKAEKLAQALGAKLGPAMSLTESMISSPDPRAFMAAEMMMDGARGASKSSAPMVEPGKQTIAYSVTASFELK